VQKWTGRQQRVVAHHHRWREARLTWGGIREHEALSGHEMRSPAVTGRGGGSMAGRWQGQGAGRVEWVEGHRQPSPPGFPQ